MVYKKRKYGKRKSYRRRKYRRKTGRYGIAGAVRKAISKMAETKFIRLTAENQQLAHNVGLSGAGEVCYGALLRTEIGTSQTQRIGDSIWGKYLKLRLWLSTKADRPNVMFRIMVINTPPDQSLLTSLNAFWRGYNSNKILDYINTDKYGIVYHKVIKITHGDTSQEKGGLDPLANATLHEVSKMHNIYIPLNRKINYQQDLSGTNTVPKLQKNCLSLCIIPYDAYGTLQTDLIASYSVCGLFCYKDM